VIAGRALAPVRLVTARARAASSADLSGRVGVGGPHDEIRELADTFDQMLERLDRAFRAQRAFSAQVSHELRTPLSIVASEAELLRRSAEPRQEPSLARIQAATGRAERMIAALLDLARSGSGDVARAPVDLDTLTGDVLGELVNGEDWRRLRVELDLRPAPVLGDASLLERLVANLLANAAQHNRADGVVEVATGLEGDRATLTVTNSRPQAAAATAPGDADGAGAGVGLTVVQSVLAAHGGRADWSWGTGTVTVRISLPAAPVAAGTSSASGDGDGAGAGAG
jgi:signal transduction histidine kinase